jgi:predicted GNAT superfamily acetyltransferase
MQIHIAPRDFNDWDGLVELLRRSFAYMEGRIDPPSSLASLDAMALQAKASRETLILAIAKAPASATILGCGFADVRSDCVYVGKVAVTASARGQGIARAMMSAADSVAVAHQRTFLELQTRIELVDNIATFTAMGFEKVGETAHPGYNRPTSVTLRRRVPDEVA